MSDISICRNTLCPSSKICYRYLAEPNPYWQSVGIFKPNKDELECDYYWPATEDEIKRYNDRQESNKESTL